VLVAIGATALLALGTAADGASTGPPQLRFAEGVPADVRRLAAATWDRFLTAFPARLGCVADVTLESAWTYRTRAHYDPGRRVVTLRVPGTAPNLSASMVHEFAHHVEFTCTAQRSMRPAFLAAQGIPPGTRWRAGHTWSAKPSEQYAQAVIEVVLGPQPNPLVVVRPEALRVIRSWGMGG
jgi:hypothetical protein